MKNYIFILIFSAIFYIITILSSIIPVLIYSELIKHNLKFSLIYYKTHYFLINEIMLILILIYLIIYLIVKKENFIKICKFKSFKLNYLWILIFIALGFSFIINSLSVTTGNIKNYNAIHYNDEIINGILYMGIIAPVLEEIIFHGIFFNLIKKKSSIIISTIVTAIMFSLLHISNNYWMILNAFILSIILTYIYIKTDSIYSLFFVHIFYNLICNSISVFLLKYYSCIYICLLGIVLFLIGFLFIIKKE